MASSQLTKTFSGASNRKTFTLSFWVKRTKLSTGMYLAHVGDQESNPQAGVEFNGDDTFQFWEGGNYTQRPSRLFRDTSAWYHIVIAVDTTQSTESDRVKIYVNGVQETVMTTNTFPSQNDDLSWNSTQRHTIGAYYNNQAYFDGLLSHIHFIDGTAYDADTFGETDSTSGIWKPKTAPSVTYGTNGFFLKFENSANMGLDSSGQTNNLTVNGTITQAVDTPSNNFATLNGVGVRAGNFTLANGNTTGSYGSSDWETLEASLGVSTGKWYYETKWNGTGAYMAGWTSTNFMSGAPSNYVGHTITEPSYALQAGDGSVYYSTSSSATQDSASWGDTFTSSDILGCAIDIDNGKIYWSKNGVWMNSGDPTSGATGTGAFSISDTATNYFWQPVMSCYNGAQGIFNFGNGKFGTSSVASSNSDSAGLGLFEYSVPSGYYALCTKNIKNYG